jgi:hypothetical protein
MAAASARKDLKRSIREKAAGGKQTVGIAASCAGTLGDRAADSDIVRSMLSKTTRTGAPA